MDNEQEIRQEDKRTKNLEWGHFLSISQKLFSETKLKVKPKKNYFFKINFRKQYKL